MIKRAGAAFGSLPLLLFGVSRLCAGQEGDVCAPCHPSEVASFGRSRMAQSVSASAPQPEGRVRHTPSSSTISIRQTDGRMVHRLDSKGLSAEYPVAWAVGAGKVGYSYLVSIPPFIFQSPVSYYSQAKTWDVTPGYEPEKTLDFTHPISEGCMFCHAGSLNLVPGSDNRFREPAFTPISCERCHGSTEAHLRKPVPGSIVNPAKLPPAARDSVCEQCHLEGEARILNPGKTWRDFKAGMELESVFTTYVSRSGAAPGVKAVSHSEQLAQSRCARESGGRLWCATCHNPHGTAANRAEEVRAACASCHAALPRTHAAYTECVSCHMPRIRPNNIAHAAITNHLIGKPVAQVGMPALSPWREPPAAVAQRNLGLALFELGAAKSGWTEVSRSYEILSHLPARDAEVTATLASVLLGQKQFAVARQLYRQALELNPTNAHFALGLGAALAAEGKTVEAITEFRRSIALDPSAPEPYRKLIDLYETAGQPALARQVSADYLKVMPQNLLFRRPN